MRIICFIILVTTIGACSSSNKIITPENNEDVVISRISDFDEKPEWVEDLETEPLKEIGSYVYSLGIAEIPGDHRLNAGYRIAEGNAKKNIASSIESKLEYYFQNSEEDTSFDSTYSRFIGSEVTNLTTSSIRSDRRYWEKVSIKLDDGQRVTRYKIYYSVKMPKDQFKKAVLDAMRRAEGKKSLSKEFKESVDKHWDKIMTQSRDMASE